MTDTQRGTDVDILRKAIAKLTAERENEARNRYRRAATPLLTERPRRTGEFEATSPDASRAPAAGRRVPRPQQQEQTVDEVKAALLRLDDLYRDGLVTIEEYQLKRVEILDRL